MMTSTDDKERKEGAADPDRFPRVSGFGRRKVSSVRTVP
jgi:hypothetical protein